jgi:tripartite-type tricarboxylate transporter receptor subunit TctC
MKLPRRKFLQFAGAAVVAPTFLRVATAQTYPSRPITMIVPFPAGAGYDMIGRIVAERMRDSLGQLQQFSVDLNQDGLPRLGEDLRH